MIHFISGLPRSGSTLLAAILRQNPAMHAGMTSPVGSIVLAMQRATSRQNEASVFVTNEHRKRLIKGVFDSYYKDVEQRIIFDTNRLWCSKLPLLKQLFGDVKILCSVREVAWIMDSIEVLIRNNPLELSGLFGYEPAGSVYTRVDHLADSKGLVGSALDGLREAFFSENYSSLLLIEYETLTMKPETVMRRVYDWLGYAYFKHDFNNVSYQADDFDMALGTPGLHTVRKKVEFIERKSVLPPILLERFANDNFWRVG